MPASRTRRSKSRVSPYAVSPPTSKRSTGKVLRKSTQVSDSAQALPRLQTRPPSPHPSATLFTVKGHPTKGKGSYATTYISPGTRLVDEAPLFSIPQNNPRAEDIEMELHTLAPALRKQFQALSSGARASTDSARFITNSIQMTGTEQGIFLQTSRFNHSCVPNAYFGFDPTSGHVRIHAFLPIAAGREISINYGYGGVYKDRTQRGRALRSYGFECACPACQPLTPADRAIEPRRKEMGRLQARIDRNNSDQAARIAELGADLRALAGLLEKAAAEGDVMYTALADTYHALTLWYHSESVLAYCDDDFEREKVYMGLAVRAAERKLQLDEMATGSDSLEAAKAKIMLKGEEKSLAGLG